MNSLTMKIQIYRDANNGFRWRMIVRGRIVADSGEAYRTKFKLRRTLNAIIARISCSNFSIEDDTKRR